MTNRNVTDLTALSDAEMKKLIQKNVLSALESAMAECPDFAITVPFGKDATATLTNTAICQWFAVRRAALEKKSAGGATKLTPKQEENQRIMDALLEYMDWDKKYTVAQLHKGMTENGLFPEGVEVSPNRLSAVIQKLYKRDGVEDLTMPIHRVVEARVAYFQKNIDHRPAEEEVAE